MTFLEPYKKEGLFRHWRSTNPLVTQNCVVCVKFHYFTLYTDVVYGYVVNYISDTYKIDKSESVNTMLVNNILAKRILAFEVCSSCSRSDVATYY